MADNGERLDRIEHVLERLTVSHTSLLTSHAEWAIELRGLAANQRELLASHNALTNEVRSLGQEMRQGFAELRQEIGVGFRELRAVVADHILAIGELREAVRQNTAAIAELRTSQALTEERFRLLIDTLRNPPPNGGSK